MPAQKEVYYFGGGKADGTKDMKHLLGGKGANLAEMVNIGIPVPPGFTITTEVCQTFQETNEIPASVMAAIKENVARVEKEIGHCFGDASNPLLFSVRSGAAASMPGMMDTVLNLGLNNNIVDAWVSRDPQHSRFVYDSYRRFITMYADIVMGIGREDFEHQIEEMKQAHNTEFDSDLSSEDLKALTISFLALYEKKTGSPFPQDPWEQLHAAIRAVFNSWGNPRAEMYRRLNNITGLLGTAVNVQAMVFGNANDRSATGVAFSRSPSSGLKFFYGEFLINAQGEDVVAGIRTPQHISKERSIIWAEGHGVSERNVSVATLHGGVPPEAYKHLCDIRVKLENHYRDMMDIEFTVEDGKLWMLQCRVGKRTIHSALRIALDMVEEKLITQDEAILRIDPYMVDHLLHPTIDAEAAKKIKHIGKALAASPGAAVGQVVFDAESAVAWSEEGKKVIMVRLETSPEDLAGMHAAEGFLTARGGMTSHAAVVARGMGKCCVCGCGDIEFSPDGKSFVLGGQTIKEGDVITLDGSKGLVYGQALQLQTALVHGDFEVFVEWCKKAKRMSVRVNADTARDTDVAYRFGAEGVGLCRTEHMFFEGPRIEAFREMILAESLEGREKALAKLLPIQRGDFVGIFRAMKGAPVTIRLLDPPLHEFVPHELAAQKDLASKLGLPLEKVQQRVKSLHEVNPMLGLRGCRLGITYPEIYNMQVQAIMEAALEVAKEGLVVKPEIMIPLVGKKAELQFSKRQAEETIAKVLAGANDSKVEYMLGTMIEVPRAALTANEIAEEADFFSFGTNDLTQMTCGFSRDDAGQFLRLYDDLGIYNLDPFSSLDQEGVGQLVRTAVEKGRSVKPDLKMGICGEHGGDPRTIEFLHNLNLSYVSCSPYRVPIAIVAAAQAAVKEKLKK